PIKNFHGLRDYYSLVKSLGSRKNNSVSTQMALARNFGGTNYADQVCKKHFSSVITAFHGTKKKFRDFSVEELIKANLEDNGARHLMIIGKSDSIVNLLTYKLRHWSKELSKKCGSKIVGRSSAWDMEPVVIYGSQFPNDLHDDYQYGVLSKIMMCVEAGRPLILTDLEIIYGSLYDLWNQNYITVGREGNQKFYTRVALGAHSNPMVCVHENFRCILVLDDKKVDFADPPLLNRFEKQKMSINDTLDDRMKRIVNELSTWCKQISTFVKNGNFAESEFKERDTFVGFDPEETLQSLVIHNCATTDLLDEELLFKCKEMLINIASADGIIRSRNSGLSVDIKEVGCWENVYFHEQHHDNIVTYIQSLLLDE
ncbi:5755_t:CDS:2, partial [Acaulospora morrowiae]